VSAGKGKEILGIVEMRKLSTRSLSFFFSIPDLLWETGNFGPTYDTTNTIPLSTQGHLLLDNNARLLPGYYRLTYSSSYDEIHRIGWQ
jgi:hypothetical protein